MTDLRPRTPAQRRMYIQSVIGQRVRIHYGDNLSVTLEVVGVAVEFPGDPDKATTVVGRCCDEDNRLAVIPLRYLRAADQLPWQITDPRHPDYQDPGRTVRPAARR